MNADILARLFRDYEDAQEKYDFFGRKNAWLFNAPFNVDEEKEKTKNDVMEWRDFTHKKRQALLDAFKEV